MKSFNQHRVKEFAILLFFFMSTLMNLNAQCIVNLPTKDTLLCAIPVDSFRQLESTDISGCNVMSIQLVGAPLLEFNDCTTDPNIYAEYSRIWQITTDVGTEIFEDTICLQRISLMDIEFPGDTTIDCGLSSSNQSSTGYPTVNGNPNNPIVGNYAHCNVWIDFEETSSNPGCPTEEKIVRNWTIMDLCDNMAMPRIGMQTIHVVDSTDPEITLINEIKTSVEHDKCAADIMLPAPISLSDNCTDSADIELSIKVVLIGGSDTYFADNERKVFNVPPGQYDVEYTANDGCGNYARDTSLLTVFDSVPPIAQGKDRVLQFNAGVNMMTLTAQSFDDGSYDLCSNHLYYKVKRVIAPSGFECANSGNPDNKYDDAIKFCCGDAGNPAMVMFRVYDRPVPIGPVEDDLLEEFSADFMLMVTVLDKAPPVIDCLEPDTIDCSEDLFDLSRLGTPGFEDNCGATLSLHETIYDLNECNIGKIIRRFIATDNGGLADTCDHIIVVRSLTPFDANDPNFLIWPRDTVLTECNAPTDTSNTGSPVIVNDNCAALLIGYEDEYYPYVENACFKILRRWKIYDWCQYDGTQHNPFTLSPGVWYHTQIIKVIDTVDPELIIPMNFVVGTNSLDCVDALAEIPPFSASDCSALEDMEFSYQVDLYNDGEIDRFGLGNDASGRYDVGVHKIHVFLNDGCGNIVQDSFTVQVQDQKPPSPIFSGSLVAELMQMGDGGMVVVPANKFKSKSEDNCTASENLRYAYSSDPNDSVRVFTCDSLGIRNVSIYVFDEAGNYDFTKNTIEIQDNMKVCGTNNIQNDPEMTSIGGQIFTEIGAPIDRVKIHMIKGETSIPTTSNRQGQFRFGDVKMNESYKIIPKKEINPINGVSTLDIVRITKHLLGTEPFDSPYQIVASDINQNGSVTSLDIVHLRKLILGIIPHFRDNKSWEFIDATYEFQDPSNPFDEEYPTLYNIEDLEGEMLIDFIGIKLGDVNYSARTGSLQNQAQVRNRESIPLWIGKTSTANGKLRFGIYARDLYEFEGLQFAVNLENDSNIDVILDGALDNSMIYHDSEKHVLRVSWNVDHTTTITDQLLFSLETSDQLYDLGDILEKRENDLTAEIYSAGDIQNITFKLDTYEDLQSRPQFVIHQNRPNPFLNTTQIEFSISRDQDIEFTIYDVEGGIMHHRQMSLLKGQHQILIDDEILPESGIYFYELKSRWNAARKKMIKIE